MANPESYLEKVIAGQVEPVSHLEKVIAQYIGKSGEGNIPTKVSQLINDKNYVTINDVISDTETSTKKTYSSTEISDMFEKNQLDTKTYIDDSISSLSKLGVEKVTEEPTLENTEDKINMMLLYSENNDNNYVRYLRIEGELLYLGDINIDLDAMYTKEECNNKFVYNTTYKTQIGGTPLTTDKQTLTGAISELNGTKLSILQGSDKSGNLMTIGADGVINADTPFIESFSASKIFLKGDKTSNTIQGGSLYVIGGQIALLTGYFYVLPTITAGWNNLSKISTAWKYKPKASYDGKAAASGYNSTDNKKLFTHIQVNSSNIIGYFTDEDTSITVNTGLQFSIWFPVQLR